jgi:hypothetical protein
MWGKRRKRCSPLSRQLSHALLEDAMARVQQQEDEAEADEAPVPEVPAPRAGESTRHGSFGRKNP